MNEIAKIDNLDPFFIGIIVAQLAILDNPLEIKSSLKKIYPELKITDQLITEIRTKFKEEIFKIKDTTVESLLSHKMAQSKLIFDECEDIIKDCKDSTIDIFAKDGTLLSSKKDHQSRLKALDMIHKEKWSIKKHELEKLRVIIAAKTAQSLESPTINSNTGSSVSITEWEDEE